jgi:hypothetical protein
MNYSAVIKIENPITYFFMGKKNPKKHYLTNNLFYDGRMHFATRNKLVKLTKEYLKEQIQIWEQKNGAIPKLEKMKLRVIVCRKNTNYDLDNKGGFWMKVFFDLMKTPTQKQIEKAKQYRNEIITMSIIYDDSAKYIDEYSCKHIPGGNYIEFQIEGLKQASTQNLLF